MDEIFAEPRIAMRRRADGTVLLHSLDSLPPYDADLAAPLYRWSAASPEAVLAAEWTEPVGWRTLTYRAALESAEAVGEALLQRGLGPERPLAVLSGNSLNHLVLTLAGYVAGIPVAPLSVTHSLTDTSGRRLRAMLGLVRPGAVYAEDAGVFAAALAVAREHARCLITAREAPGCEPLSELLRTAPTGCLSSARAEVRPDSVAKMLFTSGSTGEPKAVPNTHRMLCAVQQMMRYAWPFLAQTRLTLVDWLPWSHTFGGNHNLNMVLASGGSLYIDDGGPTPELFPRSLRRLAGLSPNVYFNVPAGFAQLAIALERDAEFAARFLADLRLMLSAGAPLQESLRRRILAVARNAGRHEIRFTTSWGLTETSSAITSAHILTEEPAAIGVPLPGITLKLVPVPGRMEMRVTGPTIMPGYLHLPDSDSSVFDEEGYYRTGDAGRMIDPADPNRGLAFDGRLAEDFKLMTGTWVRVGPLRSALLNAAHALSDVVIAGEGRPFVTALAWARAAAGNGADLRCLLERQLAAFNEGSGSSRQVWRLLLLAEAPVREAGELSDKGSVNQRRVLERRRELVDLLYRDPPYPDVIEAVPPSARRTVEPSG
jgi:feruloyl-CoA synthase